MEELYKKFIQKHKQSYFDDGIEEELNNLLAASANRNEVDVEDKVLIDVKVKIEKIIKIEGDIKRIIPFGNSTVIEFKNGAVYKQPFIGRIIDIVVPDTATKTKEVSDEDNEYEQGLIRDEMTAAMEDSSMKQEAIVSTLNHFFQHYNISRNSTNNK